MVRSLSQNWWLVILRGVLAILFGVFAFVWPGLTLLTAIFMFGIYAVVDGLIAIWTSISRTKDSPRWWTFLLEGLLGIGAGIVALLRPDVATLALIYIIASWAVITGILEIAGAIRLRNEISNEWLLGFSGLVSIILGVFLFLQPLAGSFAIIWTIAAYALIFGVLLIILGFRLRNWKAPTPHEPIPSV